MDNVSGYSRVAFIAALAWAGMAPTTVRAQAQPQAQPQGADTATAAPAIPEIVVTAELRSASTQKTPISIVALSGETLKTQGIATLNDLQYSVPSLTFQDVGNVKFINIRGVGLSEGAPNQTDGVSVQLDGAYVAREFVYGDAFFDVENVEVLRGPQGTYQGQNAEGGAIFINSKAPKLDETSGFASAEYGSYEHFRVGAGVDIPLTSWAAMRVSGEFERRNSFYYNSGPEPTNPSGNIQDQPGNLSRYVGRIQLLIQPTSNFRLRLIHQTSENDTDGTPYKMFAVPGTEQLPTTGLRDLSYDVPSHTGIHYDRTTAQLKWDATNAFTVLANAAYQTSRQQYLADADQGTPYPNSTTVQTGDDWIVRDKYFTGEVDLVSTGTGPFEWTVGATVLDYHMTNVLNFETYNSPTNPSKSFDVVSDASLFLYLPEERLNQAVFGELGYKPTATLEFKVGGRYNHDKVGFESNSYLGFSYNATSGVALDPPLQNFNTFTGRGLINWQPSTNHLFYATFSKGYKPGGENPFGAAYKSEELYNKEIGWKGNFANRAIQASISLYDMYYANFQRTYSDDPNNPNPATATTKNVSGTIIKGIEGQVSGRTHGLVGDLSFSYNDAKYGSLPLVIPAGSANGVNPITAYTTNIAGESIDFLPEWAVNAGVSYEIPAGKGKFIPSVRMVYQSSYFTSFFHEPYNFVPGKVLANAFLRYKSDARWDVEAYATNLFNKTYISYAAGGTTSPGSYLLGAPRQIGVRMDYNF